MPVALPPFTPRRFKVPASAAWSNSASPSPVTFPSFPLNSLVTQIDLNLDGVIATASATAPADGLATMAQSILLSSTFIAGDSNTYFNNVPGPAVRELMQPLGAQLPRVVGALGSTGYYRTEIPLQFLEAFLAGGLDMVTALRAYAASNVLLQVQPAPLSTLDQAATTTLAFTSQNCYLIIETFERSTVPDMANIFFNVDYFDYTQVVTGINEIPVPAGDWLAVCLLRSYSSANVKQVDGGSTPIVTSGSAQQLDVIDLNKNFKYQTDFESIRDENHRTYVDSLVAGNAALQWNRNPSAYFDVRNINTAAQQVILKINATAGTGAKVQVVNKRVKSFDVVLNSVYGKR